MSKPLGYDLDVPAASIGQGRTTDVAIVPDGWFEALDRSEDQLAAGQTVEHDEVLQIVTDSIKRLETKEVSPSRS